MTGSGTVERIFTATEAEVEMEELTTVEAITKKGLRGDCYCSEIETGTFVDWEPDEARHDGYDLTLIEKEAVTAIEREAGIELAPGDTDGTSRLGISHSTISLDNDSVSVRPSVEGIGCVNHVIICSTSLTMAYCKALTHRGGLRADILEDGIIRSGDGIEPLE